eukprot:TRINITY_DN60299_c0_g1_i1.p1 TRINITY_DN60299_c0_g1~~TRINITY_DN60299_c0_g1_i1.p1  ORF type:complete len:548 (+),score=93.52 TRINITY_DN60299_c0_g1_i1:74-1645(+)
MPPLPLSPARARHRRSPAPGPAPGPASPQSRAPSRASQRSRGPAAGPCSPHSRSPAAVSTRFLTATAAADPATPAVVPGTPVPASPLTVPPPRLLPPIGRHREGQQCKESAADEVLRRAEAIIAAQDAEPVPVVKRRCRRRWDYVHTLPQLLQRQHTEGTERCRRLYGDASPELPQVVVVCPSTSLLCRPGATRRAPPARPDPRLALSPSRGASARASAIGSDLPSAMCPSGRASTVASPLHGQSGKLPALTEAVHRMSSCVHSSTTQTASARPVRPLPAAGGGGKTLKLSAAAGKVIQRNMLASDAPARERQLPHFPFSREDYVRLKECFEAIDENCNGELDWGEVQDLGSLTGVQMDKQTFLRMDRDASGTLNFVEMLRGLYPRVPIRDINWAVRHWGLPREEAPGEDANTTWQDEFEPEHAQEIMAIYDAFNTTGGQGITFAELRARLDSNIFTDAQVREMIFEHSGGHRWLTVGDFASLLADAFRYEPFRPGQHGGHLGSLRQRDAPASPLHPAQPAFA